MFILDISHTPRLCQTYKIPDFFKAPPTFAFWMNFVREKAKKWSLTYRTPSISKSCSSFNLKYCQNGRLLMMGNLNCLQIDMGTVFHALHC